MNEPDLPENNNPAADIVQPSDSGIPVQTALPSDPGITTAPKPESPDPVAPPPDPKLLKELEDLRKFKAKQEAEQEKIRLANLSEAEQLKAKLEAAEARASKALRDATILRAAVPKELIPLIPDSLTQDQLESYLESPDYKSVVTALTKPAKLDPTVSTGKPSPGDPKKNPTQRGVTLEDYQTLGGLLLGIA